MITMLARPPEHKKEVAVSGGPNVTWGMMIGVH